MFNSLPTFLTNSLRQIHSPQPCSWEMKLRRLFQLIFVIKCSTYFDPLLTILLWFEQLLLHFEKDNVLRR